MRLTTATIHNFKSILRDCSLSVDPRITVLVGATESGKTNVLEALASVTSGEYSEDSLCSSSEQRLAPSETTPVITVEFELDEKDQRRFSEISSALSGLGTTIHVTSRYDGSLEIQEIERLESRDIERRAGDFAKTTNSFAEVRRIIEARLPSTPLDHAEVQSLLGRLEEFLTEPAPDAARWRKFRDRVLAPLKAQAEGADWNEETVLLHDHLLELETQFLRFSTERLSLDDEVAAELPRFEFVSAESTHLLSGSVSVAELTAGSFGSDPRLDNTFRLIELGGLTVRELAEPNIEQRERRLRSAGRRITNEIRKVWSQGRGDETLPRISIHLSVSEGMLRVMVATDGGHDGYPESRSLGFRWFLTFFLSQALAARKASHDTILLLDEPGIHLHPRGQRDLLERLNEMSENVQVIFSTHSPELVDLERPESWRVVRVDGHPVTTTIDNEGYRTEEGRIGTEVINRALFGKVYGVSAPSWPRNLLVEGPADRVLIEAMARALNDERYAVLVNGGVNIVVSTGLKYYKTYASILNSRPGHRLLALFDSDSAGNEKRKELLDQGVLSPEQCLSINDSWDTKKARDIEDLVGLEIYGEAVQQAYADALPANFRLLESVLSGSGGLGSRVKSYVDALLEDGKQLDKHRVARSVAVKLADGVSEKVAERFRSFLDRLVVPFALNEVELSSNRPVPSDLRRPGGQRRQSE